ncbi:MAG TPA: Rossmann-like and DUF2520 domain-containing protein, partial [Bryobacteraceae bacterium]|nr:Rossmann-like and DUF2520 domain-containing protein [Bryobacteraceae bacterium]
MWKAILPGSQYAAVTPAYRFAIREMNPSKQPIAIVGPGRVGQALGKLLDNEGFKVLLVAARRMAAARRAIRFIGSGQPVGLDSAELKHAQVFLVTTSDAALARVARQLAGLNKDWSRRIVLHTSGSVPASVLAPLKRRGAAIGSLHPFQTIPNPAAGVRNLRGCTWGIEGDPSARRVAKRWVKALGGATVQIRAGKKTIYHASAFMVCPTLVTLMNYSVRLLRHSGVSEKMARQMLARITAETANNFADLGGRRALTGPVMRGDWVT